MKKSNNRWVIIVTSIAFVLSLLMSLITTILLKNVGITLSIIVTFLFVLLGIIFDVIGVASTCADIEVFHSMAARRIKSGKIGVYLIKNASKVSSICCDVVGDICGIISGSAGVTLVAIIVKISNFDYLIVSLIVTALISSMTIGGKATGKGLAINKSNKVISIISKILSIF